MKTEPIESDEIYYIFWTGGWDSTYRVIDLTVGHRKKVQPLYIIEKKHRFSADAEIAAMESIKRELFNKYPFTESLLLSTRYINLNDVTISENILNAYENLTKKISLGGQYVYLASYLQSVPSGIYELCIEKCWLDSTFQPELEKIVISGLENYRIKENKDSLLYQLFGTFYFPIINLSKTDTKKLAEKKGYSDLMDRTWFCHNPRPGNIPCGVCPPCCSTIKEGLGYRFPLSSKIRYYLSVKRRLRALLRKFPIVYRFLRKVKQKITGKKNVIQ